MMPSYSRSSTEKLYTCDPRLQRLFFEIVKTFDCTIIEGHRSIELQKEYFRTGRSKVEFSKHNETPSKAVDVGPYVDGGIPWPDTTKKDYIKQLGQFYYFAGYVLGIAEMMQIHNIRWGGDWDRDHSILDQSFDDLVHFELV